MNDIEKMVIKRKKESIILGIIIIILCITFLILFSNDYLKILNNDFYHVSGRQTLEEAIKNKERYISVDLNHANLEIYSLDNKKENKKLNLYTLNFDNKKIMIFLRNNTVITDNVYLNIESFDRYKLSIKNLMNDKDYYNIILSNENFVLNRNIDLITIYIIYIILILSIIIIIFNIYYLNNPKKTYYYKKYMKKLYI